MIGITGRNTRIIREFKRVYGDEVGFECENLLTDMPLDLSEYVLCHGVLYGKAPSEMSEAEFEETMYANYFNIVRFCDTLFEVNKSAKVVVIGSESGFKGSYDTAYAGSKAALHLYIETKHLKYPEQQIVGISPTIIADSGMTRRRTDLKECMEAGKHRRLGRWLLSDEVAQTVAFVLGNQAICNTVIRMTGGNW